MDSKRLKQIEEVYNAVLECLAGERGALLDKMCGTDADLRREVESLLTFENTPDNFLESPPEALAAEMFAQKEKGTNFAGKEISHYKIIKLLGMGGMGEVYLAEDTKLRRNVALKLLPPAFSADNDRKKRFEKEARAVSALNHPNIITIYEIEEAENISFMATEYVDGHTLRRLIAEKSLSWRESVNIALQITGALESAHSVGIVHRDIKPANIMVREDGIVKVLDFGLAKLTAPDSGDFDTRELTAPNRVMGTINYMSPEQALGERIDTRTDIFSFGVVLHEMLTGDLPFELAGDWSANDAANNKSRLSRRKSHDQIPSALDRIVEHALEKDRNKRYQEIADLLADLKTLRTDSQSDSFDSGFPHQTTPHTDPNNMFPSTRSNSGIASGPRLEAKTLAFSGSGSKRPRVSRALFAVAALIMTFAVSSFLFSLWSTRQPTQSAATLKITPFTSFSGAADQPAFSPDGNQIAFAWDGGNGNLDIYLQIIGAGTPLRLTTNPGEDISPAWSPDGRYLAFIRRTANANEFFIIPALGGAERKLGSAEPTLTTQEWPMCKLRFSPDGKFLVLSDRTSPQDRYSIFLISVDDGEKQILTSPPEICGDTFPAFSPDGQYLAFIRACDFSFAEVHVMSTQDRQPKALTFDHRRIHSLTWTPDGREIVFSSNRGGGHSLWRISASGGTPVQLPVTGQSAYSPDIARQGSLLAYNVSYVDSDIMSIDRKEIAGRRNLPKKLISSTRQDHSQQFSPDGKKIVFVSERSGNEEIWTCDSNGSHPVQLTLDGGAGLGSPRWSPDSRQIVFDSLAAGSADIYVISAQGGKPRAIVSDPSHDVIPSWSHDGQWIYFNSNRSGSRQMWKVPAAGGEALQITLRGAFEALESPDGKLLYYTKGRGPGGIWQVPIEGGEELQVPELGEAGFWRYWTVQDDGIYFAAPSTKSAAALKFFNLATRQVTNLGSLEREPRQGPSGLTVSPDGQTILYAQAERNINDIMLVENFR